MWLLAGLFRSQAATEVCGIVNNDHWTKAGSPYLATCDVVVLGSLAIDPGVWVLFQSNNVLQVNGLLTAVGTPDDPICFTRTNGPGGWQGIYFNYGNPGSRLAYCGISNSVSSGIRILGSGVTNLQHCTIANNSANPVPAGAVGGGVSFIAPLDYTELILESCAITGNSTKDNGGGILSATALILRQCMIANNSAGRWGGGIGCIAGSVSLYDCELTGNVSSQDGSAVNGDLTAVNCTFSRNTGGAAVVSGRGVTNCTFAHNSQLALGANGYVVNSIFYFNNAGGQQLGAGFGTVAYCDIENGFGGTGNFDLDPKFASATDLHLLPGSPCIDTGNPAPAFNDTCFPPSLGGLRNDMGAYGGPGACVWLSGATPLIATQPQPQVSCLGQSATFRVVAAGSPPLSYQWRFNGAPLAGQTSTSLVLTNLVSTQAGAYSVVVSNSTGSVTSAPVQLVVNDACVDLRMYAGLNIGGQPGASYVLSYTTNLTAPVNWFSLATNTMPSGGWFYLDMASPFSPQRFYKVTFKP